MAVGGAHLRVWWSRGKKRVRTIGRAHTAVSSIITVSAIHGLGLPAVSSPNSEFIANTATTRVSSASPSVMATNPGGIKTSLHVVTVGPIVETVGVTAAGGRSSSPNCENNPGASPDSPGIGGIGLHSFVPVVVVSTGAH